MEQTRKVQLDRMFNPRGLAFFGGIASPGAFGNGCDVDAVELIEFMGADPDTQYITAYLEGIHKRDRPQ